MLAAIPESALLLAVIIIPLAGLLKRRKPKEKSIDTDISNARYAVNEYGKLVEINRDELSGHTH
ncbi:hypothetical protein [Mucilaginibacter ginsenosidivorans]|uniref:hypothetical protein n=1 Tax=Mucilaginibacter ginsenosidivorans TaxID=398053 RepID=UPI001E443092|nr:hypothetical protein [Mucilaginibacter ginsenosidivorans]